MRVSVCVKERGRGRVRERELEKMQQKGERQGKRQSITRLVDCVVVTPVGVGCDRQLVPLLFILCV